MIRFNPLTLDKFYRFKQIKRGYYSFLILVVLIVLSLFAEILVNSRALLVKYNGSYYFPTYGSIIPGTKFGFDYEYETNYRELKKKFKNSNEENFVILPPIPYNPLETELKEGEYPPLPPSFESKHYLGTDKTGRDVASRLIYGFRISIFFSMLLLFFNYVIGVTVGCLMGYLGGKFDLFSQRIVEIWNNIPSLYAIIIISSIIIPTFYSLLGIMIFYGWIGITWYMRTATYKEREREYVLAARALGAGTPRIIISHILPNTISIIITFIPFSVAEGITSLTALDYLGFGLPAPTPSWGELLAEASEYNITAAWIGVSVIFSMIAILLMVTFIGEAIRESFDPKQYSTYE